MIRKILIANRGEIAVRIIKTCRKLGIQTVSVYSDFDTNAQHVLEADEAYYLGKSEPLESYLNIEKIIDAAKRSGADAIHPGYGFLSENADFASACEQNQIRFIGPKSSAIALMGSKSAAKECMLKHQVPLVPGYHGDNQGTDFIAREALKIGFPLLIKASAGGGGKGMRVVHGEHELLSALASAKREAMSAFGDERILLEKYIQSPRHIEVQIFFDQQGHGIYIFDRDCSVQRRHQKIIEEAPAPGLSNTLRAKMGEAALACGHAIGYEGAGTVEFLLGDNEAFYFMEMNTRLQVEHPVSEMITGLDFVALQIQIANGQPLGIRQEDLQCQGHAIEVRIYAENPANHFLPSTGTIESVVWPVEDRNIRVDSGIRSGDEVGVFYDPMLAKVICWGNDRASALNRLSRALKCTHLPGVETNLRYLQALIKHAPFQKAELNTHYIEQHENELEKHNSVSPQLRMIAAVVWKFLSTTPLPCEFKDPWKLNPFFRQSSDATGYVNFEEHGESVSYAVKSNGTNAFSVSSNHDEELTVSIYTRKPGYLDIVIGDKRSTWFYLTTGDTLYLEGDAAHGKFKLANSFLPNSESDDHSIHAPMNGKLTSLFVKNGDRVEKGQILAVVEAMKMEHSLSAPYSGQIVDVFCSLNQLVTTGQQILHIEESIDV